MSYYMRGDHTEEEIQCQLDEVDLLARLPPEEPLSSVVSYLTQDQWNLEEERAMAKNQEEYNAMQCNAMQCNAMQCNAMQCNAMQCNAMQCNAMH